MTILVITILCLLTSNSVTPLCPFLPLDSQSSVEEKSDKQTDDSVTKKSRTKRLTKSQKKRQRDHDTEQENLTEEDVDERPLSKRSPCDVDKRPLSKRALEAESSHSLHTSKKQKKEKHKHKHKKHKKSRRKLNREVSANCCNYMIFMSA